MQAQNKQCWDTDVVTAADDLDGNDDAWLVRPKNDKVWRKVKVPELVR